MAQHHKGDRRLVQSRVPEEVHAKVAALSAQCGLPVSQYIADLVCLHVGRPDLVRGLGRTEPEERLPLAM